MAQTHIVIVLDRSGSMSGCDEAALAGVNGYLGQAASDAELAIAKIGILLFDTDQGVCLDWVRRDVLVRDCRPLGHVDYVPRGATPLYDAIGAAIGVLDRAVDQSDPKAVLVVMTDGYENASEEHSLASISALIAARQKDGWLVIFLGANLDVAEQGRQSGVRTATSAAYSPSERGVELALLGSLRMSLDYASSSGVEARCGIADAGFTDDERRSMSGEND